MQNKTPTLTLLALSALLTTIPCVDAATHFTATLTPDQIVGVAPTATGTGFVKATLTGGPGTWVFSYVGDFHNYDFGAYMVPHVTTGTSPLDGAVSATATTVSLFDDVRNFHIHTGASGATGPVAYSVRAPDRENGIEPNIEIDILSPTHVRIYGTWDLSDGLVGGTVPQTQQGNLEYWGPILAAAKTGDEVPLYFDIHTNLTPTSEIRGQITAVPEAGAAPLVLLSLAGLVVRARRR